MEDYDLGGSASLEHIALYNCEKTGVCKRATGYVYDNSSAYYYIGESGSDNADDSESTKFVEDCSESDNGKVDKKNSYILCGTDLTAFPTGPGQYLIYDGSSNYLFIRSIANAFTIVSIAAANSKWKKNYTKYDIESLTFLLIRPIRIIYYYFNIYSFFFFFNIYFFFFFLIFILFFLFIFLISNNIYPTLYFNFFKYWYIYIYIYIFFKKKKKKKKKVQETDVYGINASNGALINLGTATDDVLQANIEEMSLYYCEATDHTCTRTYGYFKANDKYFEVTAVADGKNGEVTVAAQCSGNVGKLLTGNNKLCIDATDDHAKAFSTGDIDYYFMTVTSPNIFSGSNGGAILVKSIANAFIIHTFGGIYIYI